MTAKREFRLTTARELRAEQADDKQYISGYAALFDSLSEEMYGFREKIMPGAFARTLRERADVRELINHDPNLILGRSSAGTLELSEDKNGLKFRCELPKTSYASDLMESIKRGDITQCSFGFVTRKQAWIEDDKDETAPQVIREIHDVDLFDTSVVTYPAYPDTTVSSRELRRLFPDGLPDDIREYRNGPPRVEKRDDNCECPCEECVAGDCPSCTNVQCDDPNCEGHIRDKKHRSRKIGELHVDLIAKTRVVEEKRTRVVAGKPLPADKFAFVGDAENIATWALPVHDARHVRMSLHEFVALRHNRAAAQDGAPLDKVWKALTTAAAKFGVVLTEEEIRLRTVTAPDDMPGVIERLIDLIENLGNRASALSARCAVARVELRKPEPDEEVIDGTLISVSEIDDLIEEFVDLEKRRKPPAAGKTLADRAREMRLEVAKRL
jgi:uncharacterized protein